MIYSLFKTTTMILCRKLDRAWQGTVCSITFGKVSSAEKTPVTEGWHYLKVSLFISLGLPGMTQSAGPAGAVVWSPCAGPPPARGIPLHVGSPCGLGFLAAWWPWTGWTSDTITQGSKRQCSLVYVL